MFCKCCKKIIEKRIKLLKGLQKDNMFCPDREFIIDQLKYLISKECERLSK